MPRWARKLASSYPGVGAERLDAPDVDLRNIPAGMWSVQVAIAVPKTVAWTP